MAHIQQLTQYNYKQLLQEAGIILGEGSVITFDVPLISNKFDFELAPNNAIDAKQIIVRGQLRYTNTGTTLARANLVFNDVPSGGDYRIDGHFLYNASNPAKLFSNSAQCFYVPTGSSPNNFSYNEVVILSPSNALTYKSMKFISRGRRDSSNPYFYEGLMIFERNEPITKLTILNDGKTFNSNSFIQVSVIN